MRNKSWLDLDISRFKVGIFFFFGTEVWDGLTPSPNNQCRSCNVTPPTLTVNIKWLSRRNNESFFTVFHHARHKNKLQQEGHFIFIYMECVIHTHTNTHTQRYMFEQCVWHCYDCSTGLHSEHQHMQKQRHCFIVLYAVTPNKKVRCVYVCVCLQVSKNTWGSEGLAVVQAEPTETPHLYWYMSFDTSLLIGPTFYPCVIRTRDSVSLFHCLQSQYRTCLRDWTSEGHLRTLYFGWYRKGFCYQKDTTPWKFDEHRQSL